MADVERDTLSVKRLLASKAISASLAQRIVEADVDKNGELSLEEVMQVMQSEQKAVSDRRLFVRILIALGVALLLLLAAVTGMTIGVVELSKDTKQDNGVMVSKDTGVAVGTADAVQIAGLADLYKVTNPDDLLGFRQFAIDTGVVEGEVAVYSVASVTLIPNVSATVVTTDGKTFVINNEGVSNVDAANGRRLLGCCKKFTKSVSKAASTVGNGIVNTATTVGNTVVDVVTDPCNIVLDKDNPCCEPAKTLDAQLTSLTASYNSLSYKVKTDIPSTKNKTDCSVTQKTINGTYVSLDDALNTPAGSLSFTESVNAFFSGCSTCCKKAKKGQDDLDKLLDDFLALNGTCATTCASLYTG